MKKHQQKPIYTVARAGAIIIKKIEIKIKMKTEVDQIK